MQIASGLPYSDTFDIKAHDEWLMDLWCSTVDEQDTVYILGDLTSRKKERARLLLEKLPDQKYLIEGNHDVALRPFKDSFQDVYQIKLITFKPSVAPFLKRISLWQCAIILTLENIYNAAMEKISKVGCKTFAEYVSKHYKPEVR